MNEAFGMMDEGYFKPRSEILTFINNLLQLNVTKIESLGQGAVYCQILDAMFTGKVPLTKVNWKAKLEWEFVNNLKVLQTSFTKLGIKRIIEVERLSKCKYQDNLEMIQWLMRFYECNCNKAPADYDAVGRRKGVEPDFSYSDKTVIPKIFNLANNKPQEKQEKEKPAVVAPKKAEGTTSIPASGSSKTTIEKESVQNKNRSQSSTVAATKSFSAPKNDTPMEKLDKIKKIVQKMDISDADKLVQISKIVGVKSNKLRFSYL